MNRPVPKMISFLKESTDLYLELVHGYAPGPVTVTRIKVKPTDHYFQYEDDKGNRVMAHQLEEMLLAHNRAELRVHDGVHTEGECRFLFRGFYTMGRFV